MSYETRFMRRAAAAGPAFEAEVKQRFGFDAQGVGRLLDMASRLSQPSGAVLTSGDVKTLQAMHPRIHPGDIAALAGRVNQASPDRRFELFAGMLANDQAAMFGDRVNASDNFREIEEMTAQYTTEEFAAELNRRRGGSEVQQRWKPEPGSVRDLIEQQFVSKPHAQMLERMEAGDPEAEAYVRNDVADRMEHAIARLDKPEASTRETLDAAWDVAVGSEIAQEQFGIGEQA